MRKIIKYIAISLILIAVIFLTGLAIKYSPTYVYRLLLLNTADVNDYEYFENRVIKNTDRVFSFEKKLDEAYVESLFVDEINNSECNSFDEWAEKSKTTALVFIRRDTILYEKYFNGFNQDSYFHSQSMAKSFISFLIGAAIEDGYIAEIDDPITKYIPELKKRDQRFEKISIKNLLMMRSGLKYYEGYFPGSHVYLPWHDEAVGYYHENVRKLLLEEVEIANEPGKDYQYCNYNTSYLGLVLERATEKTVSEYLEEKLWTQIGMEYDALFSIDSKQSGFEYMPSRLIARAIDYAKFGRLFLHEGNWNGKQVISKKWVHESTQEDTTILRKYYPDHMGSGKIRTYYKYQWWGHVNDDSTYNFMAVGNLGQTIYVIPEEQIIIVHCGNSNELYDAINDLWHVERLIKYQNFQNLILKKGVKAGLEEFRIKRKEDLANYPVNERTINTKGYGYLNRGKIEDAILLFQFNVELFPNSSNVYDSLGEAYMVYGDIQKAILNYKISFELNPNNLNAKKMIGNLTKNSH